MSQGAKHLVGEHDFTSFCSVATTAQTSVRTVYDIRVTQNGADIFIDVVGGGFLYNMVRIIAGTLMEVGRGKITPDDVKVILESCDRTKAGPTAPACGLTLMNIDWG